jgi:AcrR family transcriptional regulator
MEKMEPLPKFFREETETPTRIPKRQTTGLRRKQIVETLRKIIARYGCEQVTIKNLMKEVGVSGGALYRHFKSKREVLLLLIEELEDHLNGNLEEAYPAQKPLDRLGNIAEELLSSVQQKKGATFLVIAEIFSMGDRELNRKISEVLNGFLRRIEQLIADGIRVGEIREEVDIEMAAFAFFGMLQALVTIRSLNGFPCRPGIENGAMWKFYLDAVKNRTPN